MAKSDDVLNNLFADLKEGGTEESLNVAVLERLEAAGQEVIKHLPDAADSVKALEENEFPSANIETRQVEIALPAAVWKMYDAVSPAMEEAEEYRKLQGNEGEFYSVHRRNTSMQPIEILLARAALQHMLDVALELQSRDLQRKMMEMFKKIVEEQGGPEGK